MTESLYGYEKVFLLKENFDDERKGTLKEVLTAISQNYLQKGTMGKRSPYTDTDIMGNLVVDQKVGLRINEKHPDIFCKIFEDICQ